MDSFRIVPLLQSVSNVIIAATWIGCFRRQIRPVACVLATAAYKVSTGGLCWYVGTSCCPRGPVLSSPAQSQILLLSRDDEVCHSVLSHIQDVATGTERLCRVACSWFALQIWYLTAVSLGFPVDIATLKIYERFFLAVRKVFHLEHWAVFSILVNWMLECLNWKGTHQLRRRERFVWEGWMRRDQPAAAHLVLCGEKK